CAIHSALARHGGLRVAKRPAGSADLPGRARSGPGRAGGRPVTCPTRRRPETSRALLRLQLLPQPLLLLPELGCERLAEVLGLEDRPDFELGLRARRVRAALRPLDRLVHRLHLPEPVAGDELLRLGERPVDDGALVTGELHAHAL